MFAGELHQHRRRSESVVNEVVGPPFTLICEFMDTFQETGKKFNV